MGISSGGGAVVIASRPVAAVKVATEESGWSLRMRLQLFEECGDGPFELRCVADAVANDPLAVEHEEGRPAVDVPARGDRAVRGAVPPGTPGDALLGAREA